jgi:chromosome partitioning protein
MDVVPIANQAGSAGKTTTVVTVAVVLSLRGCRVLLVDADPQSNASLWLGVHDPDLTIGDVLLKRAPLADAVVETSVAGLSLLPASPALDGDALALARSLGGEQRLRQSLDAWTEDVENPPDVVLIDCPGAMSILTVAALVAATSVITVTQPTFKELEGLPKMEETIAEVAGAYKPGLTLAAVVPCIVPPSTAGAVYSGTMAVLQETYGELITPSVRRSARVPEAYAQKAPLPIHAPNEPVTADYEAVTQRLGELGVVPKVSW